MPSYELTIYTGDVGGAGTAATVYIQLYGDKGSSTEGSYPGKEGSRFESGEVDNFTLESNSDPGDLNRLKVRHDNTGSRPGWFLNKITVKRREDGREWDFRAYRWLASDEADNEIQATLGARL